NEPGTVQILYGYIYPFPQSTVKRGENLSENHAQHQRCRTKHNAFPEELSYELPALSAHGLSYPYFLKAPSGYGHRCIREVEARHQQKENSHNARTQYSRGRKSPTQLFTLKPGIAEKVCG